MQRTATRTLLTVLVVALGLAAAGIGVAAGAAGTTGDPGAIATTGDPGATGTAASAGATLAQVNRTADDRLLAGMAGSGTADDPYVITNASELQAMRADASAHYVLGSDVDASETAAWNGGDGFDSVGNDHVPFEGALDGRGRAIEGLAGGLFRVVGEAGRVADVRLTIADGSDAVGGIAARSNGTIANVSVAGRFDARAGVVGENYGSVRNASVDVELSGDAGVVGHNGANATIRDVRVAGAVVDDGGTWKLAGGVVAENRGLVVDVRSNATVDGAETAGGLAATSAGTIVRSRATGDVNGTRPVGGLVGESRGAIRRSHAGGDVTGTVAVGGLVGDTTNDTDSRGLVRRSSAAGDVAGVDDVGGLVGSHDGAIDRSYATGDVDRVRPSERDDRTGFGGLVGTAYAGSITDAYATGDVIGGERVAGLVGYVRVTDGYGDQDVDVRRAYATGVVHGAAIVGGLVGFRGDRPETDPPTDPWRYHWGFASTGDVDAFPERATWRATDGRPILAWQASDGRDRLRARAVVESTPFDVAHPVTLNASGSRVPDGAASYEWSITGETLAGRAVDRERSGERVAHAFDAAGSYAIELTVTGRNGRSDAATIPVTVRRTTASLSGNGTPVDPYLVESARDFTAIDADRDAHYALANDVDAGETAAWNDGAGFESMATVYDPNWRTGDDGDYPGSFDGTLDGRGHAIRNATLAGPLFHSIGNETTGEGRVTELHLTDVEAPNSAALARINEGRVSNVTVTGNATRGGLIRTNEGTVVDSGARATVSASHRAGGLVRHNDGTVRRSWAAGTVDAPRAAGGLVGTNDGTISASRSSGTVTGDAFVGGLVGDNEGAVTASRSNATARGGDDVGGLVGYSEEGRVAGSRASGTATGEHSVGGLVGHNNRGLVESSFATGDVNGTRAVGGLVGESTYHNLSPVDERGIRRSYARGNVTGRAEVGGLVGLDEGVVESAYATGRVRGREDVGGLIGARDDPTFNRSAADVRSSYWDRQSTGRTASVNGTRLRTDQMTGADAPDHMTGFDFETAWETTESYPVLAGDGEEPDENRTVEPIDGTLPRDLDGDGLYEDLNGNERGDIADAVELFRHRNDDAITDHTSAYDFNEGGGISIGDAVALFRENTG